MSAILGSIRIFAGNFAPHNWAFCHGQMLSIAYNTSLFKIIGTRYGGDGRTTFSLPDLRNCFAIGAGSGPGLDSYELGKVYGQAEIQLSERNLPAHTHGVRTARLGAIEGGGGTNRAENMLLQDNKYDTAGDYAIYNHNTPSVALHPDSIELEVSEEGYGRPFYISQRNVSMHYIICIGGENPSPA